MQDSRDEHEYMANQLSPSDTPWMRFVGLVETGGPQASRSIDEVVYENSI